MIKKFLSYKIRMHYSGGFCEEYPNSEEWYRDFMVSDLITLETLNIIIQQILNWDDSHLYMFIIKGINYVDFGLDDLVVENFFEDKKYISCAIPLQKLNLNKDEEFTYYYDFGDKHIFILRILKIHEVKKDINIPILFAFRGNNLIQYPDFNSESYLQFDESTPSDMLYKKIKYYDYTRNYRRKIRFIQKRDYDVLMQWRRSNDKRKWEKAVVILENWNLSLEQISTKIERPIKTKIKKWIDAFNWYGLKGLEEEKKKIVRNNVKKENAELKRKRLLEILHQKPSLFGINRSNWSQPSLAEAYEKQYREKISRSNVGDLIRKSGYKLKKAKRVLTSPDPNYREKVDLLLKTLQSLKPDEMFFFIDEMGPIRVKKHGGRCYVEREERLTVPKNPVLKGSVTFFAALSVTTNQISWNFGKSKDTSSMIDLIEILFNQYHGMSKLYISWDAASWHRSNELIDWLDIFNAQTKEMGIGPIIDVIPLPRCAQFLNVIESVFSGMKRAVIHHSDYQSEDEMKIAISGHFNQRNEYFKENPRRAGEKIWKIDFFLDYNNIRSGNYREY